MKKILVLTTFACFCGFYNGLNAQMSNPLVNTDGNYEFNFSKLYLEVIPDMGGRISSLKFNNKEILYFDWNQTVLSGSTFWPSPQSVWGWPPLQALDSNPYSVENDYYKLYLIGALDNASKLSFSKIFYGNSADTSITIKYIMKNNATYIKKWAPWEVTRVPAKGLTFFVKGDGNVTGDMASKTKELAGAVWYNQDSATLDGNTKFFSDGKGWIAHINTDKILFIKYFEDIPLASAATGESEIEVYTAPDYSYTELENQGAYSSIKAGDSVIWQVKWFVRELPGNFKVVTGNKDLIDYVNGIISRSKPIIEGVSFAKNNIISISPNPAATIMFVNYTGNTNSSEIRVYNSQGQLVLTNKLRNSQTAIDVQGLNAGLYYYEILDNKNSVSGKVLIKR